MGLRIYTVHDRPAVGESHESEPDVAFVRENFSWLAFVFTGFWFFAHRAWREGVLVLLGLVIISGIVSGFSLAEPSGPIILVLLAFSVGLFAQDIRRSALARAGYVPAGVVAGYGLREAEARYFESRADVENRSAGAVVNETVAIIDYGSGNLRSAAKAFERAAQSVGANQTIVVTDDPEVVRSADRVVLPGVGAFGDCAAGLKFVPGLADALIGAVVENKKPFLGICIGMQLMAETGFEHGQHTGLGWVAGSVDALKPSDPSLKIPHMGWNELQFTQTGKVHPVLAGLVDGAHAYFVHSYGFRATDSDAVLATVDYGGDVVAVVGKDNMIGTQFHPEKSQETGLKLIENFLRWQP